MVSLVKPVQGDVSRIFGETEICLEARSRTLRNSANNCLGPAVGPGSMITSFLIHKLEPRIEIGVCQSPFHPVLGCGFAASANRGLSYRVLRKRRVSREDQLMVSPTLVEAVCVPETPAMVSEYCPAFTELPAFSVSALEVVAGLGEKDAITPLGSPETVS